MPRMFTQHRTTIEVERELTHLANLIDEVVARVSAMAAILPGAPGGAPLGSIEIVGAVAATDEPYVVQDVAPSLANSRVLQADDPIELTDEGPSGALRIDAMLDAVATYFAHRGEDEFTQPAGAASSETDYATSLALHAVIDDFAVPTADVNLAGHWFFGGM